MKGKREKVVLVFDEKDRRNFLTGFRKRKNARRKKAQEECRKKEEEKRKQLREEKREALREHLEKYEDQLAKSTESDEDVTEQPGSVIHDFGEHTVTVSTITDEDMGRDFLTCTHPTQHKPKTTENRIPIVNHKNTPRDKLQEKKQFRKKAQKRKIQAMSDKKSLKQKHRQRRKHK